MRKRANTEAISHETDPQIAAALAAFARVLAPFVAAAMGARPANDVEDWIDQHGSPLGRRLHCAAARDGRLRARKVGRRWLVSRADLEAFIQAHGKAPSPATEPQTQESGMRELLAECGLEYLRAPETAPRRKAVR